MKQHHEDNKNMNMDRDRDIGHRTIKLLFDFKSKTIQDKTSFLTCVARAATIEVRDVNIL